jgi:inhibitor of cysteine peptidase
VKLVGQPEYNATPTSTQVVGSGGTTTFHFQAVKAGQTTIQLVYHRKFEQGVPPAQTMQLTVQVK